MMLSRACTMLKNVGSVRSWLGHPQKSLLNSSWWCRSMVFLNIYIFFNLFECNINIFTGGLLSISFLSWFVMLWCFVGYIGEFEYVDDHRAGKIVVELNGRLNKCGVISPRFDVGVKEIEGWTARLLPSRQVSQNACSTSFHNYWVFMVLSLCYKTL